ncbi:hypothetical protein M8J77_011493 [Diaphorina citri]|nr:hypothetical protein M8J77_011493 [Diaphorina citri]
MANSIDQTLLEMEARLRAETELNGREPMPLPSPSANGGPSTGRRFNARTPNQRPSKLGDIGTPTRMRKQLDLPVSIIQQPKQIDSLEIENKMKEIMRMNGILNINNKRYQTEMKHLEDLGELGSGTCGQVVKMLHKPSQTVIAVKQMRRSRNSEENKRIIMDLDVVLKSHDCGYIVRCLGCFITESDVWICMELMATCFDRLLKRLHVSVPEPICGKITLSTVKALHYLKETHGVIHRDVKPSNILLDERGNIKLCDFGISGRLVDSKARTKNAGCAAYMAPERIEPPNPQKPDYDIRADVWSLGITLVELATGEFPYKDCKCDFEVLSRVLNDAPPCLPNDPVRFSAEFQNFVSLCLTKDYQHRPKYRKLLEHPFLRRYENLYVDVPGWYRKVIETSGASSPALSVKNSNNKPRLGRASAVPLSSPQPFRRQRNTSELQHAYYRSASVSPNRYYVPDPSSKLSEEQSHSNAKQKITSYIKYHLGVGGNSTPPSPPPRHNRHMESASSPRLLRRVSELTSHQSTYHSLTPPQSSNSQPSSANTYHSLTSHHMSSSSNNHHHHSLHPQSSSSNTYYSLTPHHPSSSNPFPSLNPHQINSQPSSSSNPYQSNSNPYNSQSNQSQVTPSSSNYHPTNPFVQVSNTNPFSSYSPLPAYSPSPLRRNLESSPCLPRRHNVSPSPPMPPPRRLSECNSVPGSPLLNRAKYYTPEPTRRNVNLDL